MVGRRRVGDADEKVHREMKLDVLSVTSPAAASSAVPTGPPGDPLSSGRPIRGESVV